MVLLSESWSEGAVIPLIIQPVQLAFEFLTNLQSTFGTLQFLHFGLELTFHFFRSFLGDGLTERFAEALSLLFSDGTPDEFHVLFGEGCRQVACQWILGKRQFIPGWTGRLFAARRFRWYGGFAPPTRRQGWWCQGCEGQCFLGLGGNGGRLPGMGGGRGGGYF